MQDSVDSILQYLESRAGLHGDTHPLCYQRFPICPPELRDSKTSWIRSQVFILGSEIEDFKHFLRSKAKEEANTFLDESVQKIEEVYKEALAKIQLPRENREPTEIPKLVTNTKTVTKPPMEIRHRGKPTNNVNDLVELSSQMISKAARQGQIIRQDEKVLEKAQEAQERNLAATELVAKRAKAFGSSAQWSLWQNLMGFASALVALILTVAVMYTLK